MLIIQLDIAHEIIDVVQTGQCISLCRLDYAPVFRQLDTAVDSCKYYLRTRIRFWYEVYCSELEAFDFCALIRGQNDDRNIFEFIVPAEYVQHFLTAHVRHLKIKKHHSKVINMSTHLFQSFDPVTGKQQFIVIFKDIFQKPLVDEFILNNKDVALDGED